MQPISEIQEGPQQFQLQPTENLQHDPRPLDRLWESQNAHALHFGVEVKSKDAKGSATCWCLFCVHEGLDEVEVGQNGRKRKRTGNIKMFTAPFYLHKYRGRLESARQLVGALQGDVERRKSAVLCEQDKAVHGA